ncbi:hypothetical protein BO71DRAFT_427243 [Aspergillus ellipticus CBS 707.79]|uniref:Uncharacterized protein n=1 Tax=Aspergillus ellipticus CBS 707.79 TaxID=1448320 RepID=A0A319E9G7_9EURO|nr:hypothetical protein BO71DRAFT_427243 [Aspergillus ellipticus CBS 707.79]
MARTSCKVQLDSTCLVSESFCLGMAVSGGGLSIGRHISSTTSSIDQIMMPDKDIPSFLLFPVPTSSPKLLVALMRHGSGARVGPITTPDKALIVVAPNPPEWASLYPIHGGFTVVVLAQLEKSPLGPIAASRGPFELTLVSAVMDIGYCGSVRRRVDGALWHPFRDLEPISPEWPTQQARRLSSYSPSYPGGVEKIDVIMNEFAP